VLGFEHYEQEKALDEVDRWYRDERQQQRLACGSRVGASEHFREGTPLILPT
jgi:hypothetical protein